MAELPCAAVLFDMDGVLVDSQAVVKRTWRRWCERTGVEEAAVLSTAHGRRTMDTLRSVAPHLDLSAEAQWLEEAELGDREGIGAIPGAQELTAAFPDDSWAVVTSAGRELARRRLEWAGLPVPRCVVPAEHVQLGKAVLRGISARRRGVGCRRLTLRGDRGLPGRYRGGSGRAGMRVVALTTTHEADELPSV